MGSFGKFECCDDQVLAERLYDLAGDGSWPSGGDVDGFGLWFASVEDGGRWFVISEDNQGFVYVSEYTTEAERDVEYTLLEDEYNTWLDAAEDGGEGC